MNLRSAYYLLSAERFRAYVLVTIAYYLLTLLLAYGFLAWMGTEIEFGGGVTFFPVIAAVCSWLSMWPLLSRRYTNRLVQREDNILYFSWETLPQKEDSLGVWWVIFLLTPTPVLMFGGKIPGFALFLYLLSAILYSVNTLTSINSFLRDGFVFGDKFYEWGRVTAHTWRKVGLFEILMLKIEKTENLRPVSEQSMLFYIPSERKEEVQQILAEVGVGEQRL